MTITAVWPISSTTDANAGDGVTITEPAGIDDLIDRLAEQNAGAATIWHESRELADAEAGMLDHDVAAAVAGGYGYLSHIDVEHDFAVLAGDPESPELITDDVEFPAGSGVRLPVLATALREFLETGRRPSSVEWRHVEL
ncbi:Imm1 family immunity protein [Parasphingorhabdus pacifica]